MARKRRTVLEVFETTEQPLLPGGDNWESCVQVFMDNSKTTIPFSFVKFEGTN